MENVQSQYLQVLESMDDFKRLYPDMENVQILISSNNDSTIPQYGQQQVIQIQNQDPSGGAQVQQHQQIQQYQVILWGKNRLLFEFGDEYLECVDFFL